MAYERQGVFNAVRQLLIENPRISLKAISETLGIERHTIEAIVQEGKGVCFRKYRQQLLLAAAVRLVRGRPNLSIKEVAVRLGYECPRDFSRFIKNASGLTPTELRNQHQAILDREDA